MRDNRTKNKSDKLPITPKEQPKTSHVKELPPDLKKALDRIEQEEKKKR